MTTNKRIIAIDPGDQTGYAIGVLGPGLFELQDYGYTDWKSFVINYDRVMLSERPFDIVVYESWRLRSTAAKQKTGSTFPEIQCIGGVKLAAWRNAGTVLVSQEPSFKPVIDAQMGGTDYLPGRDGAEHHRDAVRHLYYYVIHKGGISVNEARRVAGLGKLAA
jgi:hypothetical protein